jgi:serine/threonine-protein kinase
MSWPSATDYTSAAANPSVSFRDPDLRSGRLALAPDGGPLVLTGNHGCVFKVEGAAHRTWAVKCFTRPVFDLQNRMGAIHAHLERGGLPCLVGFEYLPQGIRVGGGWFPVVKMEWIDGTHLHTFAQQHVRRPRTLQKLAHVWLRLSRDLRAEGIAHGDLEHGNVLLTSGGRAGTVAIRLVDYDGVWVPGLSGVPAGESGHPCYQHPRRGAEAPFGPDADRFPHLVIYTALRGLAARHGRQLWERYDTGDNLLFRGRDFTAAAQSSLLRTLWDQGGDLRTLAAHLTLAAEGPLEATPLLHALIHDGTVAPLPRADLDRAAELLGLGSASSPVTASPEDWGKVSLTLEVINGPGTGERFTFTGHDTFVVGRSQQAHFQLSAEDRYSSRYHFLVEVNPPYCALLDLGSRNGTHVNGRRVQRAFLNTGDQIRVGKTRLRVHVPEPPTLAWRSESFLSPPTQPVFAGRCPGRQAVLPENSPSGQPPLIPGYRVVRELGRGSMGVVYLAVRDSDQDLVALKTLVEKGQPSPQAVARFLREASVLQQLRHPNIVAYRDMGNSPDTLFFAMEFVAGTDAAALLRQVGALPVARAVALVRQALAGLSYAHSLRLVHRDIKPANLLIDQEGGKEHLRIADFGLARLYQASQMSGLTLAGEVGGTVAFMPPEQILAFRDAVPASDQYAAAATLYNLLTGQYLHDFKSTAQGQLAQILNDDPIPIQQRRPDLPDDLARVVHRALARTPDERWPDVAAFATALAPFAE